jgi:protein TonB
LVCLSGPLLLAACGGETEPAAVSTVAAAAPAPAAAAHAEVTGAQLLTQSDALAQRAGLALRAERLVAPATDNAFELYLGAVEADPTNALARTALEDLVTYAVLHVEQRAVAEDVAEAQRVFELIERGVPQAPALPRLQRTLRALEALKQRQAAAAEQTATTVSLPSPRTIPSPSPSPSPAFSIPSTAAASGDPAPAPVAALPMRAQPPAAAAAPKRAGTTTRAAPSTPAEIKPQPFSAPIPAALAVQAPEVVFQPPLRYPSQAERRRIEGLVELEFTIAADGSVSQVEVVRAEPQGMFEREAVGAMQRWRFVPPTAPMRARRVLEFKLTR